MRTTIKIIFFTLLSFKIVLAQEQTSERKIPETKMEAFASKTGIITKFVDFKLPTIKLFLGDPAQARIRKVVSGHETRYFYVVEKQGKTMTSTGSIEYEDLLEVIKVLTTLKGEAVRDLSSKPEYIENKFVTTDGFQFGYYITEGKSRWYIKLERSGSDNTLFISDVQTIEASFNEARNKIEEIKNDLGKRIALQN